jgi:Carboxypeptidase regulatory-like domain
MATTLGRLFLVPALAGLISATAAWGQADTGSLEGRLMDEQDVALPGASVSARQLDSGLVREATSGADGTYRIVALPPGTYDVSAQSGDLAPATRRVAVLVAIVTPAHFRLSVGGMAGALSEPAAPQALGGQSADVGQNVLPWLLENLPLNGRRFQDLALFVAGARPANDFGATETEVGGLSFGGTTGRQLSVSIDGADDNDGVTGGMLQQVGADAVQEFRVIAQRYGAEYGRSSGGLLNVVTKSGTNRLKGGAFYQWRDQRLGARTYFEEREERDKATFKQQQLGGTLGGPIRKDRAHFFLGYERNLREDSFVVDTGGALPQQEGVQPRPLRDDLLTAKLDVRTGAQGLLTARYTLEDLRRANDLAGGDTPASAGVSNASRVHSASLKHTLVQAQGNVNEVLLGFQSLENDVSPNDTQAGVRTPSFVFGANPEAPTRTTQARWQLKDDYSFRGSGVDGDHDFKLGLELRRTHYGGSVTPAFYGSFDFEQELKAPADYLNAVAQTFVGLAGGSSFDDDWTYVAAYVKDSWKPSQRLTIDAGLRYEVQYGPYSNRLDTLARRSLQAAGFPAERRQDYDNLGPRVGFVLDLRGNGRTMLHGGYGRYYEEILQTVTRADYWSQVDRPTVFAEVVKPTFTPNEYNLEREALSAAVLANALKQKLPLYLTAPDLRQPSSDQVNGGVSQQLGRHLTLDVDYVVAKGNDLIHTWYVNVADNRSTRMSPPGIFAPQYGSIRVAGNRGHSRFDGAYVNARIHTRDLDLWAAYALTWTKDLADDIDGIPSDRSNLNDLNDYNWAANDMRQRATVAGAYRLPARFLLSSTLQYGTGKPFSALAAVGTAERAAQSDAPAAPVFPRNECIVGGVDLCRSGESFSWDARVSQAFKLGPERELEVFVQSFNITNHANFERNSYDTTFSSATFGQPARVLPHSQRQVELGVRLRF